MQLYVLWTRWSARFTYFDDPVSVARSTEISVFLQIFRRVYRKTDFCAKSTDIFKFTQKICRNLIQFLIINKYHGISSYKLYNFYKWQKNEAVGQSSRHSAKAPPPPCTVLEPYASAGRPGETRQSPVGTRQSAAEQRDGHAKYPVVVHCDV